MNAGRADVDAPCGDPLRHARDDRATTMSTEHVLALFSCAIGVALLVVSLAFPSQHRIVRIKREPIYVRVADSAWAPLPGVTNVGRGHPVEPR
jgi:hypothetical protein